jgi:hypothetical protein
MKKVALEDYDVLKITMLYIILQVIVETTLEIILLIIQI